MSNVITETRCYWTTLNSQTLQFRPRHNMFKVTGHGGFKDCSIQHSGTVQTALPLWLTLISCPEPWSATLMQYQMVNKPALLLHLVINTPAKHHVALGPQGFTNSNISQRMKSGFRDKYWLLLQVFKKKSTELPGDQCGLCIQGLTISTNCCLLNVYYCLKDGGWLKMAWIIGVFHCTALRALMM